MKAQCFSLPSNTKLWKKKRLLILIAGTSDLVYASPWLHNGKCYLHEALGGETCLQAAQRETCMVLYGAVRELLERSGAITDIHNIDLSK